MLPLFSRQDLLDEPSVEWIFDVFAWAGVQFGGIEGAKLVLPNNQHFPGNAADPHAKACLIFDQVKSFAGTAHWPCELAAPGAFDPRIPQHLELLGPVRRLHGKDAPPEPGAPVLVAYDSAQLRTPEMLIAGFAHILAHYMATKASELPPGGAENWPHAMEVLAVFLGFGLMFANTAYISRSVSCGSCQSTVPQRKNYLSQFDVTYALALFCVLRDIPTSQVRPYLKKTLHGYFKRARKDVLGRSKRVELLRTVAA